MFAVDKDTEHYLRWRETAQDWLAKPGRGIRYDAVFPNTKAMGA